MTVVIRGEPEDEDSQCSFELEQLAKLGITADIGPQAICLIIQNNAHRIKVRMNLTSEWKDTVLSEMPPRLAVWWAIELVKWSLTMEPRR